MGEHVGKGNEEQTVDVMNVLVNFCQIYFLLARNEVFERETRSARLRNGIVCAISLCGVNCHSPNDPFIESFLSTKMRRK